LPALPLTAMRHLPVLPAPAGSRELEPLKTYIQDKARSLLELTTE
jgi:hypothetical protein